MKKRIATIFVILLAIAMQSTAQKPQAVAPKQAENSAKKSKSQKVTVVPEKKMAAKPVQQPPVVKPVNKVAAAKMAHEQKVPAPQIKIVTAVSKVAEEPKVEENEVAEVKAATKKDSVLCFPLKEDKIYSLYTYVIDLRDKDIIRRYKPMFDRNNYEFTGYVWQGLLKQMINNASDKINKNVFIKAEDDLVCFTITKFEVQKELPEYICPILSSASQFASYVRKANREDINNY